MAIEELKFHRDDWCDKYREYLVGSIFHSTTDNAFKLIVESGAIKNNKDLRFTSIYDETKANYGTKRGYICLLDFRESDEETLHYAASAFDFLILRSEEVVYYFIMKDSVIEKLIDIEQAKEETSPKERFWVPYHECWYPEDIVIGDLVEKVIKVELSYEDRRVYTDEELKFNEEARAWIEMCFQRRQENEN